jgi:triosephosphate isomerase (TIM)
MRTPWFGGNWKMYKTIPEALEYIRTFKAGLPIETGADIILAPPFTALQPLAQELKGSPILLAAQNVHWKDQGAFTGEISPLLLRDAGCSFCIIGHSERRQLFGETDESVREKMAACLKHALKPVLCLGETLMEREKGLVREVITRQFQKALAGFSLEEAEQGVIAYEPVWAIGTGKTATPEAAQEVHELIRSLLLQSFNKKVANDKRIVYGGSVTPENIQGLMEKPDIDGALVGGASLKPDSFLAIIEGART